MTTKYLASAPQLGTAVCDTSSSGTPSVALAQNLLLKGCFNEAASTAEAIIARGNHSDADTLLQCMNVYSQACFHLNDINKLNTQVENIGGACVLPVQAFLLWSLVNIKMGQAAHLEAAIHEYHAKKGHLSSQDELAICRLMTVELHCKALHNPDAAQIWIHGPHIRLSKFDVEQLMGTILQHKELMDPFNPSSQRPGPATQPHTSPFITITGEMGDSSVTSGTEIQPAPQHSMHPEPHGLTNSLMGHISWLAAALKSKTSLMSGTGGWHNVSTCSPLQQLLTPAHAAGTAVIAAMVYALYAERGWLRLVVSSVLKRLRGAVWPFLQSISDLLRISLALNPSPIG